MKRPKQFHWQEVEWFRPFDFGVVENFMNQLSGFTRRQPFIWEIHIKPNSIKYYLGTEVGDNKYLKKDDEPTSPSSIRRCQTLQAQKAKFRL